MISECLNRHVRGASIACARCHDGYGCVGHIRALVACCRLLINLNAVEILDLTIPPFILAFAIEVIE